MGSSFNKIVPEIIQSSIWNEESDIRIVWITMIATKDQDGYVRGDARTLARMANVSVESAEKALKRFQEPDANSHTPDNDGRRIEPASGGWMVINSDVYRETGMTEASKEYWREKKRLQRMKKKENVQDMSKTCPRLVLDSSVSVSVNNVSVLDKGVQGEKTKEQKDKEKFDALWIEMKDIEGFADEWSSWCEMRKKKTGTPTIHALWLMLKRLSERKNMAVEALQEAIISHWTGLKWEWFDNKKQSTSFSQQKPPTHHNGSQESIEHMKRKIQDAKCN